MHTFRGLCIIHNTKDTNKYLQEHNSITDITKVGCNHVEQVDIQVAQNSKDGKHLSDYNQTHTSKLMIIRDDTNTKLQKKLRSAFLSKHRQRIYIDGIIFFATSSFEKEVCEYMKCIKVKELEDNTYVYELPMHIIKKDYLK